MFSMCFWVFGQLKNPSAGINGSIVPYNRTKSYLENLPESLTRWAL